MFDPFDPVLEGVLGDFTAFSPKSSFTSSSESTDSLQHNLMSTDEAEDANPSFQAAHNTPAQHLFAESAFGSYGSGYGFASSDIRDTLPDKEMLSSNSSPNGPHNISTDYSQSRLPPLSQIIGRVRRTRDDLHRDMLIKLAMRSFRMTDFHEDFNASAVSAADMDRFHQEFNAFTSSMSQMVNDFYTRLTKAETERDDLRKELSAQREKQQRLEQQLEQMKLQQRHEEPQYHQEYNHEQQQTQPFLPNATMPVSTGSHLHDAADASLVNPSKSKSEKASTRKALTIKIPGGPIPMVSLKSGFPTQPTQSADARLGETPDSPLPFVTRPASAPIPFTLPFPSPFTSDLSSCGMIPPSPFLAGPTSGTMTPPSPFMATPAFSGMETPTRLTAPSFNGMETPSRYTTAPSPGPMGPSTPFMTIPASSGMTPQRPTPGALSSSGLGTPVPWMSGPPSGPMPGSTRSINYRPSSSVDLSPLTPDRIGPETTGDQRTVNSVLRRKLNNLVGLLPPSTAYIPEIPLTDTEIIVFFFQSLSRPEVSLRLYARKWGPQTITAALNKHRNIAGGYLRNTTSVKCTSAIKKGRDKHGDAWYEENKTVFANAGDWLATELIRHKGDELEKATDFELSKLDMELKQFPLEGVDGGIFTRCVKWCCEHKDTATYTLKNVHELVVALRWGEEVGKELGKGKERAI